MEKNYEDMIDLYLLGKLDADSTREFEQSMQRDPQLEAQVQQMRGIITAFEKRGEQKALAALQRVESEDELRRIINRAELRAVPHNRIRRIYLWSGSAAAAVIAILIIGLQPQYSTQNLYQTYHTSFLNIEITPSRGDDNTQELQHDIAQWDMAMQYLNQGKRDECAIIINKLIEADSELSSKATELRTKIEQRRWF